VRAAALACVALGLLGSSACGAGVTRAQRAAPVPAAARWVLLPFANHSDTPQSAERVEALTETVLRMRGLTQLAVYSAASRDADSDKGAEKDKDAALTLLGGRERDPSLAWAWARSQGFGYAVSGSVEEWRYKSTLDGEPAVGVTLRVTDLAKDDVVWSASGTDTGPSHEAVSGTALRLIDRLVGELELRP
jgi:hypothetical protein